MWHKVINENKFISLLYNEVPELINVIIIDIKLEERGRKLSLLFEMPKYADNPPKKWDLMEYNRIVVQLDFFDIKDLSFTSTNKDMFGDIRIEPYEKDMLKLCVSGTLNLSFGASGGLIQKIDGYTYKRCLST